jgi:hypothetical protein
MFIWDQFLSRRREISGVQETKTDNSCFLCVPMMSLIISNLA